MRRSSSRPLVSRNFSTSPWSKCCRGVVQGRHHVGECFEGTGKLFPFVDGGVCLGHEDVSFEYVDVGFSDTYYGDVSLAIPNLYNSLKSINFHIVLKEPHPPLDAPVGRDVRRITWYQCW